MNNEDKIKYAIQAITEIEQGCSSVRKYLSEIKEPVQEPEFKQDDWLEFSNERNFNSIYYLQIEGVYTTHEKNFRVYINCNKDPMAIAWFKYARRPYDRIIPHDGGLMPEWVRGKQVTGWDNKGAVVNIWNKVKEYRVHKE